jgi:hypothetical protein
VKCIRLILPILLIANATHLHAAINPFALGADARPRNDAGRIVTDAFADDTGLLTSNVRTFGWQFQTIPGDPYFIQDPGFNATNTSGLPPGSALGFNATRHLAYWDGSGRVDFTQPMPSGESLTFNFAAGTVNISATSPPQPGFNFVTISSSGSAHRHLNAYLNAGSSPVPANGAYLTSIRLTNTAGLLPSRALFLVFGNGIPTPDVQRALHYVANPLPGDANFSGSVDIADFATLAANFNAPGEMFWYDGDFNDDLTVGIADFSLLASNFNLSAARSPMVIPEPSAFFAVACVLPWLFRRR